MTDKIQTKAINREFDISSKEIKSKYIRQSKPVILSNVMQDWPAVDKWSFDYIADQHGDIEVPVYSSKPASGKQHQHAAAKVLPLKTYFNMLKAGENDLRMFFFNLLQNAPSLLKDFTYPDIGIKFFKRLPVLFVGGKGAKVQMHYDIDYAHLLLCHFGGKKKILLIPPEQTPYMYRVPYSFSSLFDVDFSAPDFSKYPALEKLNGYTAELSHGDALYIPPGFWHYIIYEDAGFSMTLRAFPNKLKHKLLLLKNVFVVRNIEGLMRKFCGQAWNDRNEKLAITKTHQNLTK